MPDPKKNKKETGTRTEGINKEQIPISRRSRILFYLIMFMIPVLFFVLLELGLRLFNYGYDTEQWIDVSETQMGLNLEVAKRYFTTTEATPISIRDVFDKVKQPNAFRVFVLGGSSAAGYPYMPMGSFSRYIRKRLELSYPDSRIEVVNVAMTAVNTYTILDLLPGIMEQSPDLIIIYAGHNEFYGALGVGSMESLGKSRSLVKLLLYLNKFKTVQLLRQIIQKGASVISSDVKKDDAGTLMSQIAKEQYIPLNSELYYAGLDQFEGNMRDIIELTREKNVPLIIGTLASNLKDQRPFISNKEKNLPAALDIFEAAKAEYIKGNYISADSLFRFAKDLDMLRFRAPEDMNKIIKKLTKEYNIPLADIDSAFAAASPDNITANNLMTDHLHPTLDGYMLIGREFFDEMSSEKILPGSKPVISNPWQADSITQAQFYFSRLDSLMAEFKIIVLKNDWPFVLKKDQKQASDLYALKDFIDTLAYRNVNENLQWVSAQLMAAEYYEKIGQHDNFIKQMKVLIYQFPFVPSYYDKLSNVLLKLQRYQDAYSYLTERYKIQPDAYSAKWLGSINLNNGNTEKAIKFFEESLKYNSGDAQLYYNLAGAYVQKKNYQKAYELVEKCLLIKKNYPQAQVLKAQLAAILKQNNGG